MGLGTKNWNGKVLLRWSILSPKIRLDYSKKWMIISVWHPRSFSSPAFTLESRHSCYGGFNLCYHWCALGCHHTSKLKTSVTRWAQLLQHRAREMTQWRMGEEGWREGTHGSEGRGKWKMTGDVFLLSVAWIGGDHQEIILNKASLLSALPFSFLTSSFWQSFPTLVCTNS